MTQLRYRVWGRIYLALVLFRSGAFAYLSLRTLFLVQILRTNRSDSHPTSFTHLCQPTYCLLYMTSLFPLCISQWLSNKISRTSKVERGKGGIELSKKETFMFSDTQKYSFGRISGFLGALLLDVITEISLQCLRRTTFGRAPHQIFWKIKSLNGWGDISIRYLGAAFLFLFAKCLHTHSSTNFSHRHMHRHRNLCKHRYGIFVGISVDVLNLAITWQIESRKMAPRFW